jgi:hypothetical protein
MADMGRIWEEEGNSWDELQFQELINSFLFLAIDFPF